MNIRNYNIYFNTHTISGILICAILYVIFFAGSFSFFKDEISAWQNDDSYIASKNINWDYNYILDSLHEEYNLQGREINFYHVKNSHRAYVNIGATTDTLLKAQDVEKSSKGTNFLYHFKNKSTSTYASSYDMGEFLYRLHFLAQLNQVPIRIGYPFGYVLAGLVSFLFVFALITGLLLHWDKIVSNFFIFRPWSKWKNVWTDMHTALGVIGFPFQFMYAVTGVVLIFNAIYVLPFTKFIYDGKSEKAYEVLGFSDSNNYEYLYQPLTKKPDVAYYIDHVEKEWPHSKISAVNIRNYGDQAMHITIEAKPFLNENFAGHGKITFLAKDNSVIYEKSPIHVSTYTDKVKALIYHLHYGDFGGYPVKITFFVLGLMGCLVIISGILIWLVARDKNNVPKHKRIFNFWASNVFLAICLTMFPVTAFSLIAVKLAPEVNQSFIYSVYFYSWLILSVFYILRKNLRKTNKETLLLGSVLSLCIPLVNGMISDNWIWNTYLAGESDIMFFDILWLIIGIVGILAYRKIKPDDKHQKKA